MNERAKRAGGRSKPLTIGALSRATSIPAETLRTWERRYGSPLPERKPSGHRLYPSASVDRLRRVARLLGQGHRPGELLRLSTRELDTLLSLSEARAPAQAASSTPSATEGEALQRSVAMMIRAAKNLDRESFVRELRANWIRLGPLHFLQDLAGPLMIEIGREWEKQGLEIRHEHFASACLTGFLRDVREPYDHAAKGPRVVAALFSGDRHEGGLLMAAALLAVRGCRILYLGADTPVEQIAAAATTGGADAVAVSIPAGTPRPRADKAIAGLRDALPRRMPLWVGGSGAPPPPKGVERFETLTELGAKLSTWI